MDREALAELSREQLLELVVQLAGRVAELEARLGQPPKRPGNSSVPPSVGFKPDRAGRRARKRRRGHDGISRRRQPPDVIVRCRPGPCQGCGEPVPLAGQRRVGRTQVVEPPPLRPVVIEAWRYAARCRRCGTRTEGAYPAGLEPTRTFGPGVEALLGYFHERQHVGYERLVELCRDVFGLTISEGGIDNALSRLAERARPAYEALGAAVRASPVIGSDETGARVAGKTAWQWAFQTPAASYLVIVPRRNAEVIAAFLGETRPEGWVSDLWAPQVQVEAAAHQLCLAHQIRDLTYAVEVDGPAGAQGAGELRHVFSRALRLHRERGKVPPATFANRGVRIERAADRLIFGFPIGVGEAWQLQKRYRRHRGKLFVCLHREDIEPTNNGSERDLRNSVIHDKVTGGYRSRRGAEQGATFATLLTTARKLGQDAYARLCAIAGPSPILAAGLPACTVAMPGC
jgi:transposase